MRGAFIPDSQAVNNKTYQLEFCVQCIECEVL